MIISQPSTASVDRWKPCLSGRASYTTNVYMSGTYMYTVASSILTGSTPPCCLVPSDWRWLPISLLLYLASRDISRLYWVESTVKDNYLKTNMFQSVITQNSITVCFVYLTCLRLWIGCVTRSSSFFPDRHDY